MTRFSLAAISVVLITIVVGLVVYRWSGDEAPAVPPVTELEREQKVVPGPAQGGSEVRVAAGPVVGPEQDGLRVLVMRRDRQPVAGATIEVIGEDRELRFSPTGDDGSTRALRLPNCDVYLRVRKDGLTGLAQWRWSTELVRELTIWMNPDRDVEVAVTDRAGARLAGTKVGLFAGEETDFRSSSTTGVADAEGVARIRVDGNTWLALHATVRAAVMGQGGTVAPKRSRGRSLGRPASRSCSIGKPPRPGRNCACASWTRPAPRWPSTDD